MNLEFIKQIDYDKYLNEDQRRIVERFGVDVLIGLHEEFGKMSVYFSTEPFTSMAHEYVSKMKHKKSARELAREFGKSERWVYNCWNNGNGDNLDLFEGGDND